MFIRDEQHIQSQIARVTEYLITRGFFDITDLSLDRDGLPLFPYAVRVRSKKKATLTGIL